MARKIYYKVLTKDRLSAFVSKRDIGAALEYPPRQRVEADPRTMGIFVFDNRKSAEEWSIIQLRKVYQCRRRPSRGSLIVPCHGHGRPRRPKLIPTNRLVEIKHYLYKNSWSEKNPPATAAKPIEGTVCFKAITCLE